MIGFGPGGVLALLWAAWVAAATLRWRRDVALVLASAGGAAGLAVGSAFTVLAVGAGLFGRASVQDRRAAADLLVQQTWSPLAALLLALSVLALAWGFSARPVRSARAVPVALAVATTVSGLCAVGLFLLTWADVLAVAARRLGAGTSADLAAVLTVWGGLASVLAVVLGLGASVAVVRDATRSATR